jgi:hypothetical protein
MGSPSSCKLREEGLLFTASNPCRQAPIRARLTFQGVTTRLTRGAIIDGVTLASDANITLGDGTDQRAEITAPITVSIDATAPGTHTSSTFDLRSQHWLSRAALDTGRVEDGALQATITTSTRVDRR